MALTMFAWKCASCHFANMRHLDVCRYCGGTSKIKLEPVAVANAQQNTPNHEILNHILEAEELARGTDTRSFEEQIEKRKKTATPVPAWMTAEKGHPDE